MLLYGLGPIALVVAGCGLLWLPRLFREYGNADTGRLPWVVIRAVGWLSLLCGLALVLLVTASYLSLVGIVALVLVLLLARRKHREAESRALLWCLSNAADHGYSMESAARAFAREREGTISERAEVLAEYLELGVRLSLALRRSNNPLPDEAIMAADMGQHTGALAGGLRSISEQRDAVEHTVEAALESLFYVVFVVIAALIITAFHLVTIFPVVLRLYSEFALEPPRPAQLLLQISEGLVSSGSIVPFLLLVGAMLIVAFCYYCGFSLKWFPGIQHFWWRMDCAAVMRWLAIAVQQNRSISETTRLLSSYCPRSLLRRRLVDAARRMEKGVHWCDSLRRANIIRRADAEVFRSAERVGNLKWALEAMADSSVRRFAYRLRGALKVGMPTVTLLLAAIVLFISVATLSILFDLIRGLS